jgi:putative glutamine amidotransferase
MKPIIGLTTRDLAPDDLWEKPYVADYVKAIEKAGGEVRLLPAGIQDQNLMEVFSTLDGVVLSGGGDVEVSRYGGQPHPAVDGVIPSRDDLEIRLTEMAMFYQLPILGICRGIQVMNVALGGTLYTDIPDQLGTTISHSTEKGIPKETINHVVDLAPDCWLAQLTQKNQLQVNSRHHQGILQLASGLQVMATSPDGLIEAVQVLDHPYGVGVQWHPENLTNQEHAFLLFESFIQSAAELM